jgi:hypothetical protein
MKDKRRDLRSGRSKREAMKRHAQRYGATCWLCGKPIDMTLPYWDRWAYTADHEHPIAAGGHINGPMFDAHRACNSSRGDAKKANPLAGQTRVW